VLRKIVAALILVPLAVVIIAFAVANRQIVTVSLDPFSASEPAAAVTLPLFALIIFSLIVGVLIGGLAAWLRQGKWRATARRLERRVEGLRKKVDTLEGTTGGPTIVPDAEPAPRRLTLKPPIE
jgi:uncharacterized integral membrane protein